MLVSAYIPRLIGGERKKLASFICSNLPVTYNIRQGNRVKIGKLSDVYRRSFGYYQDQHGNHYLPNGNKDNGFLIECRSGGPGCVWNGK
ncbi:hypothetical protein WR25_26162 [Diploscapter pachys]|uniref:Uncharacterized protein n=1 Tax=Diploscapter pachys TaxID=2018661 RepID=A0A2A2J633_9BILA|nr:hypothetical protein WR25_26162 [Diploscapter pachys]